MRKLFALSIFVITSVLCPVHAQIVTEKIFVRGENGFNTYRIPAIVRTNDGTLLAFAEARKNSASDTGDIDLVLKRSADGGKTWSGIITVWDDGANVCGNPSPVVDQKTGRVVLVMSWNNGKDEGEEIRENKGIDTRRVFVTYSDDDGVTWTKPKEITSSTKRPEWTWYATGPSHAIQLSSGRIIVPCDHGNMSDGRFIGITSHLIFSDDIGETWQIGAISPVGDESTVVELKNGDILLNMRKNRNGEGGAGHSRLAIISRDEGESFGKPFPMKDLVEPICNASIISYWPDGRKTRILLFSNPADTQKRINMTLKASKNRGRSWKEVCTLTPGPSAYSDLCVMPNGDVAVLFECGEKSPYETISFALVPASIVRR